MQLHQNSICLLYHWKLGKYVSCFAVIGWSCDCHFDTIVWRQWIQPMTPWQFQWIHRNEVVMLIRWRAITILFILIWIHQLLTAYNDGLFQGIISLPIYSPTIKIRQKIRFHVIKSVAIRFQHVFVYAMTAQLPCHRQIRQKQYYDFDKISMKLRWKNRQWNGSKSPWRVLLLMEYMDLCLALCDNGHYIHDNVTYM